MIRKQSALVIAIISLGLGLILGLSTNSSSPKTGSVASTTGTSTISIAVKHVSIVAEKERCSDANGTFRIKIMDGLYSGDVSDYRLLKDGQDMALPQHITLICQSPIPYDVFHYDIQ